MALSFVIGFIVLAVVAYFIYATIRLKINTDRGKGTEKEPEQED